MMSFIKEYRKCKKQDCLARKIAARHGMTAEYEAARKRGVSPLEALKDCGKVTEEERKTLQEVEETVKLDKEDCQALSTILTLILTIFSLVALIVSARASYKAIETTEKVSSKEYQMTQNMKSDLVELVAALRSIDDKAAMSKSEWKEYDFSSELKLLNDIQSRPGYQCVLYFLQNGSDRFEVENGLKTLSCVYLVSNKASMTEIRSQAERIMKVLDYHPNIMSMEVIEFEKILQFMLKARNYDPIVVGDVLREHESRRKDFLEKLMREGFEDPDIRYYYYTFVVPDSALANQARQAGAYQITYDSTSNLGFFEQKEVWKQSLWQSLENEYLVKYHEFLISR